MSYDSFPSIRMPDYGGYVEQLYKPSRRTESDANTISVRPKAAFVRRRFDLTWGSMPQADKNALQTFFQSHAGLPFNFTPWGENSPIVCVFSQDELTFTAVKVDATAANALRWRVELSIEEAVE